MKMAKNNVLWIGIIVALAVAVWLTGFYPVLSVNGKAISARRFQSNYDAAEVYYNNVAKMFRANGSSTLPEFQETGTKADVLTQLVEASLIHEGVHTEAGDAAEDLIGDRIAKYKESTELQSAAKDLYGLEFNEFTREVILPQAERDILAGRLFLKGESIEEWLAKAKESASVRIYHRSFRWTGERVEAKN
jgi:hypothetical protein